MSGRLHFPSPESPSSDPSPPSMAAAIERAVEREGGDRTDALDLAEVWQRVARDTERRAGGIRAAVGVRRCNCADGGERGEDGRCEHCFGVLAGGPNPDHAEQGARR